MFYRRYCSKTENGDKKIKDIKVGDKVYSQNPETEEKGLKRVKTVYINKLVHVFVDGQEIKSTEEHPYWVVDKGWIGAKDLQPGDKVSLSTGKEVVVTDVFVEHLDETIKVYNFEVEDWHTYYVSDSGVLVHNMCAMPKNIYNSIKHAPGYPSSFKSVQNGMRKVNINHGELYEKLRLIEPGQWKKVYKDGYNTNGRKISIHYFESKTGKVFDVKVKQGWSNR